MGRDVPLGCVDAECLDKLPQDRQRQIIMSAIRRLVERQRQMWLMRKRAKPFASLGGYAPNAPSRQFEPNQAESKIGPGACFNKTIYVRR